MPARRPRFRTIRAGWATGTWACRPRVRWMRWRFAWRIGWWEIAEDAAGLEITVTGPTLRFTCDTTIAPDGRRFRSAAGWRDAWRRGKPCTVKSGSVLGIRLGIGRGQSRLSGGARGASTCRTIWAAGAPSSSANLAATPGECCGRAMCCISCDAAGRRDARSCQPSLRKGDKSGTTGHTNGRSACSTGRTARPTSSQQTTSRPSSATAWKVHHNSDRTGVRLIGPKPAWARKDGGEAGLHPSNIHDNAYAVGTIDFTGDMPVILGPDGPSLGGFVCPATIVQAELWKIGQLKPGDLVRFRAMSLEQASELETALDEFVRTLDGSPPALPLAPLREDPILRKQAPSNGAPAVVCRADGDRYLLVEYGPNVLDLNLRFRVHALESQLRGAGLSGILDITPGVRSLHIHYDGRSLAREELLETLDACERRIPDLDDLVVPSRVVHLPLSWDDPATQLAIRKYTQGGQAGCAVVPEQHRVHSADQWPGIGR